MKNFCPSRKCFSTGTIPAHGIRRSWTTGQC
jgi:hypothetical protein